MDEASRILNVESLEQCKKDRDLELARILKLRMVITELRRMRASDIDLLDKEQVVWALKMLNIRSYLRLNEDNDDCLLDLECCRNVPVSYTERKAIRQHLINRLRTICKRSVEFVSKMRSEIPKITIASEMEPIEYARNSEREQGLENQQRIFIDQLKYLELQRRENLLKLIEMRNRKCTLMKAAAEIKLGPHQLNELRILYAQSRMNQVKAMLLRGFLINELVTRSEHSFKAIKEIERFIDELLEQTQK